MHRTLLVILFFSLSCQSPAKHESLRDTVAGKWLIVYPEHKLKNGKQKLIYSKIQDSIVGLTGLKLVTLSKDGTFQQADSFGKKGKWGMTGDNIVFIENGGKGFENFAAHYAGYRNEMLQLAEIIEAEGEKIELVWHLKKITGGSASHLFDAEKNEWRKRPGVLESENQIRQRLSAMLHFYSDYYHLVTKESSFFVPARVILPLKFYQHAIGISPFTGESFFASLFFSREQAAQAHLYLKLTVNKLKDDFPGKKNYVEEYAEFMNKMAIAIIEE